MSSNDKDCVKFLQWALPRMHMRWQGFRKVRRQVCRRIETRIVELGLSGYPAYGNYLESNPDEWEVLDSMTQISISRFFRDRKSWDTLQHQLLPQLALRAMEENRPLRCWSAGCASGEEPYSMVMLWYYHIQPTHPTLELQIIATDADKHMLDRARMACYPDGNVKHCPGEWLEKSFIQQDGKYCLKSPFRDSVKFMKQDIRNEMPDGPFDLVFCKNLAGMYFAEDLALRVFEKVCRRIRTGGFLLLGNHEPFPVNKLHQMEVFNRGQNIYRKSNA